MKRFAYRAATLIAATTAAAAPAAAFAHSPVAPVVINCHHCTIVGGDIFNAKGDNIVGSYNGTNDGTDSGNGPVVGRPVPNDYFLLQTSPSVRELIRVSQSGDVGEFSPYPPFLYGNINVTVQHVRTTVVYRTPNDDGRVTITTDADRMTCNGVGSLSCRPGSSSYSYDPIRVEQR